MKLQELRAFIDARLVDLRRGVTKGGYDDTRLRDTLARTFIAGARSGLQFMSEDRLLRAAGVRTCRVCSCTDLDCRQCFQKTGQPCRWVELDLCSACEDAAE